MDRGIWRTGALLVGALALLWAGIASAAPTPEQKCNQKRYLAAAKYAQCQQKALARLYLKSGVSGSYDKFVLANRKCTVKLAKVWDKLPKVGDCSGPRFKDNGDGTVTDGLTGLVWEKKTTDGSLHDVDNYYTWSTGAPWLEDGTVFTTFLSGLNGGGGFAGSNGWRMPTWMELAAIRDLSPDRRAGYECVGFPCIDAAFGPTTPFWYWSSTTYVSYPWRTWDVSFDYGFVNANNSKDGGWYVRAVRGGL